MRIAGEIQQLLGPTGRRPAPQVVDGAVKRRTVPSVVRTADDGG
jgi:hypothetical protein